MNGYMKAFWQICRMTFGRETTSNVLEAKEKVDILLRILGVPSTAAIAAIIQGYIPGVKNLYPWAFPLIVANAGLSVLLIWAGIRLVLGKQAQLVELEKLANEAVDQYNRGIDMSEDEAESYDQDYFKWRERVKIALTRLGADTYAERLNTIGADYVGFLSRSGLGDNRDRIRNRANVFYSQHKRLRDWINSGDLTK